MLDERKQAPRAFQVKKKMDFQQFCKKILLQNYYGNAGCILNIIAESY